MKRKWLLIGLAAVAGCCLLFFVAVSVIRGIMGDERELVVGSGVGLVEVKGIIMDSQETVKQLNDFAGDNRVKAVVLRIDSPGGVVGPSQEIHAAVRKLAAKKKVVASMGSIAASGGYYIAVPAHTIYANPGTLTGSIGVLMKLTNVEGLMGKIGVKANTLTTGKFKDAGSPLKPLGDEERAMLQGVIDSSHGQFVKAVSEGRKLPVQQVASIADGRIMTGEQALEVKLVDRLGTLSDAVEEAGKLAGIGPEPHLIRPPKKRKHFFDVLVEESAARIGVRLDGQGGGFVSGLSINYLVEGALPQ